jgi:hypothetical protein
MCILQAERLQAERPQERAEMEEESEVVISVVLLS